MSKMGARKDWNKAEAQLAAKKGKQGVSKPAKGKPVTAGKRTARPR
jgi:hypothetical protein